VPIIINGGSRSAGGWWAKHLGNAEKNERIELVEILGLSAETMPEAFREMRALSLGTGATTISIRPTSTRAPTSISPQRSGARRWMPSKRTSASPASRGL